MTPDPSNPPAVVFTPSVAVLDLVCSRCQSLGISTPTILAGQEYVHGKSIAAELDVCMDCWDRLSEECEKLDQQEGEEWKT